MQKTVFLPVRNSKSEFGLATKIYPVKIIMLNEGAIWSISKHCRILPIITCRTCGFTMKISSRGHRLLNYIVNRNTKTDGLGPFKACNLNGSTTFLNAKCYTYILSKKF